MTVKERMAVKVLWLANWTADEIARFEGLSEKEVEELIKVFKGGKKMTVRERLAATRKACNEAVAAPKEGKRWFI